MSSSVLEHQMSDTMGAVTRAVTLRLVLMGECVKLSVSRQGVVVFRPVVCVCMRAVQLQVAKTIVAHSASAVASPVRNGGQRR